MGVTRFALKGLGDETDDVIVLQTQLNRWARWLGVVELQVDGIVGQKTFAFCQQVAVGFVPEVVAQMFGPTADITDAVELAGKAAEVALHIAQAGDYYAIDGAHATKDQVATVKSAITAQNAAILFVCGAAEAGTPCVTIPEKIVGGGAALPSIAWVAGGLGIALVAVGLVVRYR